MNPILPADRKPAERNGLRGPTVALSLVLHLVGFGAALGLPRLLPRRPLVNPVYVVDLVSLPPGGPAKPAEARRKGSSAPAPKKPAVQKPNPEKPVKIPDRQKNKTPPEKKKAVPKPQPAKPKTPEPEPPKPEPARPAPAASETVPVETPDPPAGLPVPDPAGVASVPSGGIGVNLGGSGAGGPGANDEFTFYLSLLDGNIRRAWTQPVYHGTEKLTATVSLTLSSAGRILLLDLITSSSYDPLDRSVIRAVSEAAPFPPFPHFLGRDSLTVQIVFDLDPNGEAASSSGE